MNHFDRIYDLHKLLASSRYPVPRSRIEAELECSRATAKRTIESLRIYLGAPIAYDRKLKGFYYDRDDEQNYELPGLWFNASELHALLSVQQLLLNIQPGLLDKQLAPLRKRIDSLLDIQQSSSDDLSQRIRILSMAARPVGDHFQPIAGAVAQQKRLKIHYKSQQQKSEREISPQRLTYYRDNWYLDAWCHLRNALRTFALDAITAVKVLPDASNNIAEGELDRHYSSAYGIFSGEADQLAVLLFSADAAPRIAREQWHPQQQSEWLDDGCYQLKIPYHNPAELIMDILRHGSDVEVIAPQSLRQQVVEQLQKAVNQYA
jgi:proteasome accessory factor C